MKIDKIITIILCLYFAINFNAYSEPVAIQKIANEKSFTLDCIQKPIFINQNAKYIADDGMDSIRINKFLFASILGWLIALILILLIGYNYQHNAIKSYLINKN